MVCVRLISIQSIETIGRSFIAALLVVIGAVQAAAQETAASFLAAANEAVATDDYASAQGLLAKASVAARGDAAAQAEITELRREVGALQKDFAKLAPARETLKKSPADPAANRAVGEFYAFGKGDWERGLPLLARGDDEALKTAAALDLKGPNDAAAQLEAGDRWKTIADAARDESAISRATLRARHWYLLAAESPGEAQRQAVNERLGALRFFPSKIVIFNAHGGRRNNRGTLLADLKLLLDGKVVFTRRLTVPWQRGVSVPLTVRVPRTQADAVQVDVLKWHNNGGALAEIEAYQDGANLARGGAAEASASYDSRFAPACVSDGDHGDEIEQNGLWLLPNDQTGWVRVSLDGR